MSEIVYIGGPRDGEHDSADVEAGDQISTLTSDDIDQASELTAQTGGVVELGLHVYDVAERPEGLVAEYRGLFGPREIPR